VKYWFYGTALQIFLDVVIIRLERGIRRTLYPPVPNVNLLQILPCNFRDYHL